jgi:hypothetical protein
MAPSDAANGGPVRALRSYLHDPGLAPGSAAAVLRAAFLAVFAGQVAVATVLVGVLALVAGRQDTPSGWVAAVTLVGSLGQLLLGIVLTATGVRQAGRAARRMRIDHLGGEPDAASDLEPGRASDEADADGTAADGAAADEASDDGPERRLRVARSAALSNALLSAVLLSTPAWFGAFAWVTGQTPATLVGIAGMTMSGYAFGVLQAGPLARAVTVPPPPASVPDASREDPADAGDAMAR